MQQSKRLDKFVRPPWKPRKGSKVSYVIFLTRKFEKEGMNRKEAFKKALETSPITREEIRRNGG